MRTLLLVLLMLLLMLLQLRLCLSTFQQFKCANVQHVQNNMILDHNNTIIINIILDLNNNININSTCCIRHDADDLKCLLVAVDAAELDGDLGRAKHAHLRRGPLAVVLHVAEAVQALVLQQSSLPTTFLTKPPLPQTQHFFKVPHMPRPKPQPQHLQPNQAEATPDHVKPNQDTPNQTKIPQSTPDHSEATPDQAEATTKCVSVWVGGWVCCYRCWVVDVPPDPRA
jgi:hypothetical protein